MYRMNLDDQLDAGDYFALLKQKRAKVNEEMEQDSDIFRGLVFYVNGQTDPPQNVLHEMVGRNGGLYQYHHDGKVTHIIAEQLSATKLRELGPRHHVVRAQWVVDCLEKKMRLPTSAYEIDRGEERLFVIKPKSAVAAAAPLVRASSSVAETSVAKSSKDPEFLKDYFAQSRLHHLSAWRAEFQEELADEMLKALPAEPSDQQQQPQHSREPIILHVDMDCFFASVAMRHNPGLQHVPVAVCHDSAHGEVSACNYLARDRGVKNGMFVKEAKALCPDLQTVPYQFALYEETSKELFKRIKILLSYSRALEIVSCDEAYLDVSVCSRSDWNHLPSHQDRANAIANSIRADVLLKTGCKASIGISYNMLLARMATRRAKPDGQFLISPDMALEHLTDVPVSEIPGVGYQKLKKLKDLRIETCGQMQDMPQSELERLFGPKTGEKLFQYCRGVCDRKIQTSRRRKNIGLDVNYGIRFDQAHEVVNFMDKMCAELVRRLDGRKGKRVTVKLMIKREDWKAPSKFLGHGRADTRQKSTKLDRSIGDLATIATTARKVYDAFGILDVSDIVGIGVTLGKLDEVGPPPEPVNIFAVPAALAPPNPAQPPQKPAKYATMTKEEIDPEVLKALGPQMSKSVLKEFEMAEQSKASASGGLRMPVKHAAVVKQSRIVAKPPEKSTTKPRAPAPAPPKRNKYVQLDLNEVDASVLSELGEYGEILKAEMEEERKRRKVGQATVAPEVAAPKPEPKSPATPQNSDSVYHGRYEEWRVYFVALLKGTNLVGKEQECENVLLQHLRSTMAKCNLEDTVLILSDLNRVVDEKKDAAWIRIWNALVEEIQAEAIKTYGAVLNFDLK